MRLTTLAACGDVNRNVMGCAIADIDWRAGLGIGKLCNDFANHFAPRTSAYWEIWCDGEKWGEPVTPTTEEPIYGKYYMPRKFKMAFAVPEDNDVDLYSQDIGWEIVHENGRIVAFDVIVGGGLGHSHNKQETYPRLGDRAVRILPEELYEVAEAIFGIQRDFGDRSNRQHARFKYLISERGVEWFREELARRLGRQLPPAGPKPKYKIDDHLAGTRCRRPPLRGHSHRQRRVIDREGCSRKRACATSSRTMLKTSTSRPSRTSCWPGSIPPDATRSRT